jgi:tRNA A-37 threonylcarbamoyl transferase component Bud32
MPKNINIFQNKDVKDFYVIKRAKNTIKNEGLQFEIRLYEHVLNYISLPHILKGQQYKNMLKLQYTCGKTLYECMEESDGTYMLQHPDVLFQIIWTLCSFEKLGITHHDMHFRNILIEKRPYYSYYEYTTNNSIYRGWSNIHIYIIDFDHGTKIKTTFNTVHICNNALQYWVDVGAYNDNPIAGFDWFTFLFFLSTYIDIYPTYISYFNLPDIVEHIPNIHSFPYPGRPVQKSGICLSYINKLIGSPFDIIKSWDIKQSNIHKRYHALPLPPIPVFIYNQTIPTWYTDEVYNHYNIKKKYISPQKYHLCILFLWCGIFSTYPSAYIQHMTSCAWILYSKLPHILFLCHPFTRTCIKFNKYENRILHKRVQWDLHTITQIDNISYTYTPASHNWYPCMVDEVVTSLNLHWRNLVMPIHIASVSHHTQL